MNAKNKLPSSNLGMMLCSVYVSLLCCSAVRCGVVYDLVRVYDGLWCVVACCGVTWCGEINLAPLVCGEL